MLTVPRWTLTPLSNSATYQETLTVATRPLLPLIKRLLLLRTQVTRCDARVLLVFGEQTTKALLASGSSRVMEVPTPPAATLLTPEWTRFRIAASAVDGANQRRRSEEHTSELQSPDHLVC